MKETGYDKKLKSINCSTNLKGLGEERRNERDREKLGVGKNQACLDGDSPRSSYRVESIRKEAMGF